MPQIEKPRQHKLAGLFVLWAQAPSAAGYTLLLARLCHAFGMSRTPENFRYRVVGMGLTFSVILVSAAYLLIRALIP